MAHHRGPKTITQDLIFHYDTGNEKSFAGEPTTNMVSYSEYQYLADGYTEALSGWDTHEGTMLIDVSNKVPGFTNRSIKMTCVNANVYKYHFGVPLTNGQTYTISFWAKAQIAGNYDNFMLADGPGGYLIVQPSSITTLTTEFTRFKHTFSMTSRDTGTYNFATYLYGNGQVVWLTGFQVENKSQATRYLPSNGAPSTRSVTQGLLDLSKRSVMTVANASFDSNAMLNFDGTNDYIQLTSFPQPTNFITCEAWINPQDSVTPGTIRGGVISSTNSMYLGIFDSADGGSTFGSHWAVQTSTGARPYNTNGQIPRNQWTHIVGTYNGSTSRMYINGVEIWNASLTGTIPSATYYIGTYGGTIVDDTHNFNGYISVAKIYNRALTAEQVFQNYNASKSRFGL